MGMAAFLLMACVSVALAADDAKKERKPGPGGPLGKVLAQLNLTEDQKAKIKPLADELHAALKTAKENNDKDAAKKAMADYKDKVFAVLDDAQKAKAKELLAAEKPKKEKAK
jgi:Spy/CpxP family protein refolding chaperone